MSLKKLICANIALLSLIAYASPAFSWGKNGHRITAQIAANHLSDEAKKQLTEILGQESPAQISTWPDEILNDSNLVLADKLKPEDTKKWHYTEIPDGMTYESSPKNPTGDVVTAIQRAEATLKDSSTSKQMKREALKFLIHFMGDVSCPMHVGNGMDEGGNLCEVKWFGQKTKLHTVWDSSIIQSAELSFSEYAQFVDHPSKNQIQQAQTGTPAQWANESRALGATLYPKAPDPKKPYCKKTRDEIIDENAMPDLSYDYVFKSKPIVEQQLLVGGLRLAGELNSIFTPSDTPSDGPPTCPHPEHSWESAIRSIFLKLKR